MDLDKLCLNCLKEKPNAQDKCPYCGFDNADYVMRENQLPPYTILNGKYVIGHVIDIGGFGIVYQAMDLYLNKVVAIKELFPTSMMTRNTDTHTGEISASYTAAKDNINEVREKFIREARTLAKYENIEGIVRVKDLFEENGTAYFVMEYLEGIDLKEYVRQKGTLTFQETMTLLRPIFEALKILHAEGIIHRDISPDNIMLLNDGRVKLLDFGGVKNTMNQSSKKSEMVMVKRGYTPIEQYSTSDNIGPWTDIYALCATIYKCITGITPSDPVELMKDGIEPPSKKGVKIPAKAEKALLKGMEVNYPKRIKDMGELMDAFYGETKNAKNEKYTNTGEQSSSEKAHKDEIKRITRLAIAGVIIGAIAVAIATACIMYVVLNKGDKPAPTTVAEATVTSTPNAIPEATETPMSSSTLSVDSTIEKIRNSKVGDYVTYGEYEQENNKIKEIEWEILAKEDNRILVISKYGLDCQPYNSKKESVTWEKSSIRKWLNEQFINDAFTDNERERIPTVTVTADENPEYNTNPGNDTQDKVFLLSIKEVNTYFDSIDEMTCKPTRYAKLQGAYTNSGVGNCSWWLRSPGNGEENAAFVYNRGGVKCSGDFVTIGRNGVRPAMWIDLN